VGEFDKECAEGSGIVMKLTLPKSLVIKRDRKAEGELLEIARKWIDGDHRTPGLHMSDLLEPRKAYWRIVKPMPTPDRLIPIFLIGKILHVFMRHITHGGKKLIDITSDEGSRAHQEIGITYSPDDFDGGNPVEYKSSRSFYPPRKREDLASYLTQLLGYQACTDKTTGFLRNLYLNLRSNGMTSPEFRCWKVTAPKKDLKAYREAMKTIAKKITSCVKRKKPTELPLCTTYFCGPGCSWWDDCKPEGRYPKKDRRGWKQ